MVIDCRKADDRILASALWIRDQGGLVLLLSNDRGLRIEAQSNGLQTCDSTKLPSHLPIFLEHQLSSLKERRENKEIDNKDEQAAKEQKIEEQNEEKQEDENKVEEEDKPTGVLPAVERLRVLADLATDLPVWSSVPVRRYLRSAAEMVRRAKVALAAGRLEEAYVLLLKYVALHVERLPKHRDYGAVLPEERRRARVVALEVVARAEKVKEILRAR